MSRLVHHIKCYCFFSYALFKFDIFHFFFDGGILRFTILKNLELSLLRFFNKKIILIPYGSDAFVYDIIPNFLWRHILMINYPHHGDQASKIQKRLRLFTKHADVVVGCLFHITCLPRWDILPLLCYPINTDSIQPTLPQTTGKILVAHATNHRGIKGTEFLLKAIQELKAQGFDIEVDIIENISNDEALNKIKRCDIYVDQLNIGYALAAIEAMAAGKVVISAINQPEYEVFKRFSYFDEVPIIAADATNILPILKKLLIERNEWPQIGQKSRLFVEKRHSYKSSANMFEAIYKKIWFNQEVDLINFFHPLRK